MGCRERSCEREEPGWQVTNRDRQELDALVVQDIRYASTRLEMVRSLVAEWRRKEWRAHIQAHVLLTVSPLSPSTVFIHTGSAINQSYYRITFSSSASHQRQPCRIPVSVLVLRACLYTNDGPLAAPSGQPKTCARFFEPRDAISTQHSFQCSKAAFNQ